MTYNPWSLPIVVHPPRPQRRRPARLKQGGYSPRVLPPAASSETLARSRITLGWLQSAGADTCCTSSATSTSLPSIAAAR